MFYLIASIASATEPATLGASPPSGADLAKVEDGWRFERPVEIDGQIVGESGLSIDGHIQQLRWSASGSSADVLASWHMQRSPANGCVGPRDRWVGIRDGVVYERTTETLGGKWQVIATESLQPGASCAMFAPKEPPKREVIRTAPPTPSARPLAVPAAHPAPAQRQGRPQVARDPSPALAARIHVETTDLSDQPVKRIAGWCLAEHPAFGSFHWEAYKGSWRIAKDPGRSPESNRLASCMDAMLAPMPARGAITISVSP